MTGDDNKIISINGKNALRILLLLGYGIILNPCKSCENNMLQRKGRGAQENCGVQ
jgi:hypothetical protein